jgi:uncharacterized protein
LLVNRADSRAGPDRAPDCGLYLGWVRHRRLAGIRHGFRLPIFLCLVDLDQIGAAFRTHPAWRREHAAPCAWYRGDFLGGSGDLRTAVLDEVERVIGRRPRGPIRVLTHLRTWGYVFNPVTLYYCLAPDGAVDAVVAEITNTPWGQRHRYVTDGSTGRFAKRFHVSPFQPMEQSYRWRFTAPGRRLGVHMVNDGPDGPAFDATLALRRRPWTARWLGRILWRFPHVTCATIAFIHWHALRLWWKGARFYPHPMHATPTAQ